MFHRQRILPLCSLVGAVVLLAGCAPYTAPCGYYPPPPPPDDPVIIVCPGPQPPAPSPPVQVGGTPDRNQPIDRDKVGNTRPPRTKPETVAVNTRPPRSKTPTGGSGRTPRTKR